MAAAESTTAAPTEGQEERERVEAARLGDNASFNWLVQHYRPRIYRRCLGLLSDPDAAEDATQEAFLSAFTSLESFDGRSFGGWLYRIATNASLDMLRSRRIRHARSLDATPTEGAALQVADRDPMLDPEKAVLYGEVAAAIASGIGTMPEPYRSAVRLITQRGMTYDQAAALTGAGVNALKSRVFRGRAYLREYLQGRDVA